MTTEQSDAARAKAQITLASLAASVAQLEGRFAKLSQCADDNALYTFKFNTVTHSRVHRLESLKNDIYKRLEVRQSMLDELERKVTMATEQVWNPMEYINDPGNEAKLATLGLTCPKRAKAGDDELAPSQPKRRPAPPRTPPPLHCVNLEPRPKKMSGPPPCEAPADCAPFTPPAQ